MLAAVHITLRTTKTLLTGYGVRKSSIGEAMAAYSPLKEVRKDASVSAIDYRFRWCSASYSRRIAVAEGRLPQSRRTEQPGKTLPSTVSPKWGTGTGGRVS